MASHKSKKTPSVEEMIAKNPNVDAKQFREGMAILGELEAHGVEGPRYRLSPPFGDRLPKSCQPQSDDDSLSTRLSHRP